MKFVFALAAILLLAGGLNVTAMEFRQRAVRRTLRRGSRAAAQSDSDAPLGCPPRAGRGGAMRRRLRQWPGRVRGTAAMWAGRLRRHGLHLFPEAPLCLYWKQPGYTACYPGPGNCYWRRGSSGPNFIRPPLLQLSYPASAY